MYIRGFKTCLLWVTSAPHHSVTDYDTFNIVFFVSDYVSKILHKRNKYLDIIQIKMII